MAAKRTSARALAPAATTTPKENPPVVTQPRKTYNPPSPDHFAAVGKRVISASDNELAGTVSEWVSHHSFVVQWDHGLATRCTVFDVEPEPTTPE